GGAGREGLWSRFQGGLREAGLRVPLGGLPLRSVGLPPPGARAVVSRALLRLGVRAVLPRPQCLRGTVVSFLITAGHSAGDIDAAVAALDRAAVRLASAGGAGG